MRKTFETQHRPTEIRLKKEEKALEVDFADGKSFTLSAEYLRVESPSAEVQGHGQEKRIVPGRKLVGIMEVEAVGNYAIRIKFDDLHDTGIYTWDVLYDLGANENEIWAAYLDGLKTHGLTREP
ncbi:MAG: DUF971 domain-containing protein [Rhodospirillaceae bacterium]|nr:DUF971 domain-containing protein [Rhodospirillales bacterium]MBT6406920.1 DUF971 domain-containing protein [Rhodospirillaceae bacterium]